VGEDPRVDLVLLDSHRGCAKNRALGVERSTTEYVFFLDDDAEIFPGTIELLVDDLDRHPDALVAAANVVLPHGTVQICGGDSAIRDGVVAFWPLGAGHAFDAPEVGATGTCRWVAGAGALFRRSAFERFPLDRGMAAYYEDTEWGFRVEKALPGAQRRCPEALVLHHQVPKDRRGSTPPDLAHAIRFVEPIAHFYRVHGVVMEALFGFVPELTSKPGYDVPAARLFLELLSARGAQWTIAEWLRGGLAPIFPKPALVPPAPPDPRIVVVDTGEARAELTKIHSSKWWILANRYWSLQRRLRAAFGRREMP